MLKRYLLGAIMLVLAALVTVMNINTMNKVIAIFCLGAAAVILFTTRAGEEDNDEEK